MIVLFAISNIRKSLQKIPSKSSLQYMNFLPICGIAIVRSLLFRFLDNYEGNANISVPIRSSSTVYPASVFRSSASDSHTAEGDRHTRSHMFRYLDDLNLFYTHNLRQYEPVEYQVYTIPRYPDHHNALLPIDLMRKLGGSPLIHP